MEALALRYRPHSFDDLVGQRQVQVILRKMVETSRVPQAMVFDGPRGTGKTTTARILAASLNCEGGEGGAVPCGHCPSCKSVFDGSSFDVIEIDAASNGLVDDIRALRQQVLYSVGGRYRVVLLDEAQSMSTAAFNALLKTLEEPPPATVFVLLTTEPKRILDTVLSRCMPFTFRRIAAADIAARLAHIVEAENFQVEPDLLHVIAERSDGGLRDAVMSLDQVTRVGISTVAEYSKLMGEADPGPALLTAIVTGNPAASFAALTEALSCTGEPAAIVASLTETLRDIMVLGSGGAVSKHGEALAARQRLAEKLTPAAAFSGLKLLWDLRVRVRGGDTRTGLDLVVAMLGDALATPKAAPQPTAEPARRMSLAEMAAMR